MTANQPTTIQFSVDGMHCGSCVGRVQRALAGVDGVRQADVNLAAEMATVAFEAPATPDILIQTLTVAGYPAREDEVELEIEGMSCASCVGRVDRALAALPGVRNVAVNLASETARVRFLHGQVTLDSLLRTAAAAGYPAKLRENAMPDDRKDTEARGLRRNLILAAALTLPVFIVEMGGHLYQPFHHWVMATIGQQTSWVAQFVLVTLVLAFPGRVFLTRGIPALLKGAPDMNSLVAMGTLAAYGYSTLATFAPTLLPQAALAVYFEAAAVIVTLILLGRWLEARAKGRTGSAIRKLVGLQVRDAEVERDGAVLRVPLDQINVGDIILARPGDRIAVDGEIISGTSHVDESMISGEAAPVSKHPGEGVIGGTVNGAGALKYRATQVGADTVLSQIIQMVQQAQGAKLPVQTLVDRITMYFVPVVMVIAALTVGAWLIWGPGLGEALVAGVGVLIIACPCAMGLATPTSIMVGTGRAAELGVLFRKGDALQGLQSVGMVAFDKTGTLTEGRPEVTHFSATGGFSREDVMRLVAAVETQSEHPIAAALVRAHEGSIPPVEQFESVTGRGVRGLVDGHKVSVGSIRMMKEDGVEIGQDVPTGQTPLFVTVDGKLAASIGVSDPIRPTSEGVIAGLKAMGLRVAMITGDVQSVADAIAGKLGIDQVVAEVHPGGKVDAIHALKGKDRVAFVGDGINDAPALAEADVGIAMGSGTDIAIESADVVLTTPNLRGVASALGISSAVMRNIRQNLVWAFGYNVLLIPVAAGVFYPVFGWQLSPMLGAAAMALSSVFVVTNALRLRRWHPEFRGVQ